MKTPSPHLPPQSCSVPLRRNLRYVWNVSVVIIISFLTGVLGTLVTVTWVMPFFEVENSYSTVNSLRFKTEKRVAPSQVFASEQKRRMLRIVDRRKKVNDQFYRPDGLVGTGVILTDGGWFVMPLSTKISSSLNYLEVVDSQGQNYKIEKTVVNNDMIYGKISGEGLRVASFPDWATVAPQTIVWQTDGVEWDPIALGDYVFATTKEVFAIDEEVYQLTGLDQLLLGRVLWTQDGHFVGFAGEDDKVLLAFDIERNYTSLLSEGELVESSYGWQGYLVKDATPSASSEHAFGFLITSSPTDVSSSTVGIGDVIIEINGDSLNPHQLYQQIQSLPDSFSLGIVRDGEMFDIMFR